MRPLSEADPRDVLAESWFMKNLALFGLLLVLCVAPCAGQSLTKVTEISLRVTNMSDRCAWATIYTGRMTTPWQIVGSGWIKSGAAQIWKLNFVNTAGLPPIPAEVKVRAEFRPKGCSGSGGDPDRSNENKGLPADEKVVFKYTASASFYGGGGRAYGVTKPVRD